MTSIEIIDEMFKKVDEQKRRKDNGLDNARYILTGFTSEQLTQVKYFLLSYRKTN